MFIVINNDNLTIKPGLKQLNQKLKTDFKIEDFKKYNHNYILNINNDDLDFKRDTNEINRIFVQKLYKKDIINLIMYGFFAITIILLLITMSSVSGSAGMIEAIARSMNLIK